MEDVRKQLDDMKKLTDEMRKLKAIIVKHENRIRALEASQKARDEDVLDNVTSTKVVDAEPTVALPSAVSALAPDEV